VALSASVAGRLRCGASAETGASSWPVTITLSLPGLLLGTCAGLSVGKAISEAPPLAGGNAITESPLRGGKAIKELTLTGGNASSGAAIPEDCKAEEEEEETEEEEEEGEMEEGSPTADEGSRMEVLDDEKE
jgi:hypothetical protein